MSGSCRNSLGGVLAEFDPAAALAAVGRGLDAGVDHMVARGLDVREEERRDDRFAVPVAEVARFGVMDVDLTGRLVASDVLDNGPEVAAERVGIRDVHLRSTLVYLVRDSKSCTVEHSFATG